MLLSRQLRTIAGVLMLLLVVVLVVAFFTAETPSSDPEDIATDLQDLVLDNEARFFIGMAMQLLTALFVALLGAALYVGYRARDRLAALIGLMGFWLMAALFTASAAAFLQLHTLAQDVAEGGVSGADEADMVQLAAVLTDFGDTLFFLAVTAFAIGLIGFGLALVYGRPSPAAAYSDEAQPLPVPAVWLRWVPLVAGVFYLLTWLALAAEILFVFLIVAFVLTIIWYLSMGSWLLFRAGRAPQSSPAPA